MLEKFDDDSPVEFEWDSRKSDANLAKHGFDFEEASQIFYSPIFVSKSDRNKEERWVAIGSLNGRLIAVVFTRRKDVIRIISARRARKNEENAYHHAEMGRPPKG
jgi:uncharacterized DUF497 family protein